MTTRGPLTLAALASAAVPGLDPDTVQGVTASGPADPVDVAFVQDREHRRWVIRCPRTPAASAQLERSAALLAVLARRLTLPVPAVKGWAALPEGGRAAVHSYLTGRLVSLAGIEPRSTLARGLGRGLAHLHNLDPSMYEEGGVPVYDAAGYRSRRLAELDRAAATGRVPTGLLGRWERVLDDEALWTFTTTPTHGGIGDDTVLATPEGDDEPDLKAFLGWESAQVADPADDIAPLLAAMDPEAFDTVMEAYAHTRVERPDRDLHRRAEVVGEMQLVRTMMSLVAAGDHDGAEDCAARLRRLDERVAREEDEAARPSGAASGTTSSGTAQPAGAASAGARDRGADGPKGTPASAKATQPVATGPSDSATDRDVAEGDGTDPADDDAVQVEHPARVTPVATAPDATGQALDSDGSGAAVVESGTEEPPREASEEPDTNPVLQVVPADDDSTGSTDPTGASRQGHGIEAETDEIVPLGDDEDDDVVPPRP